MLSSLRSSRLACCVTAVALLVSCVSCESGRGRPSPPRSTWSTATHAGAQTGAQTGATNTPGGPLASPTDREPLGDFCGWYTDELSQSMDTISEFLGAFGVSGGDYNDPQIEGPAQDAAQAAGDAADSLNGFLASFPNNLSDSARRAVLGLRDAVTSLASAIRDQQGSDQINAQVALFDEAYKALRPACA